MQHFRSATWSEGRSGAEPVARARCPAAVLLGLPAAYFVAAVTAIELSGHAGNIAAFWFSGAILLTVLVRRPVAEWPRLFALAFLADVAANLVTGSEVLAVLIVAPADMIEVLLVALSIRRFQDDRPWFVSQRTMAVFAAAAIVSSVFVSFLGSALMYAAGIAPFVENWRLWATADALGLLIGTPMAMAWLDPALRGPITRRTLVECAAFGTVLALVVASTFGTGFDFLFVAFPLLVLITLRLRLVGATAGALVVTGIAVWFTFEGVGPIAYFDEHGAGGRIQLLQIYFLAAILSTLPLAIILAQRGSLLGMLRRNVEITEAALGNIAQGLSMYDAANRLVATNERYAQLYDIPARLLVPGTPFNDILDHLTRSGQLPGTVGDHLHRISAALRTSSDSELKLANGKAVEVKIRPLPDGGWVATHEDVTERVRTSEHIAFLASHDPLTGLPNRVTFAQNLERGLACARQGRRVALHTVDLDRFKEINDTLGHFVGDAILREVAARLQRTAGDGYAVCRLAGDEFTVIQLGIGSRAHAGELAQEIVAALSEPYQLDAHTLVISASVGIAIAPDDSESPEELVKKSDLALYCAKSDGRGTYRFFEAGMDEDLRARRELEADLRLAVQRGEFDVHYQPVLELDSFRISGFEALVRWSHPTRGVMYPDAFIEVAEDTGLIVPMGEWVLRQACRDAAEWPEHVKIAVNLSPAQFRRDDLVGMVLGAIRAAGLDPRRLELEITESVLLHDENWVRETLLELRRLGIGIAMDDFGTGYSSLRYLRSFPFDRLKIDRSFTADIAANPQALAIVRATIALAQSLGMKVTAEGVESAEQVDILTQEGCTEAQGFYIGHPATSDTVPLRLSAHAQGVIYLEAGEPPLKKRA